MRRYPILISSLLISIACFGVGLVVTLAMRSSTVSTIKMVDITNHSGERSAGKSCNDNTHLKTTAAARSISDWLIRLTVTRSLDPCKPEFFDELLELARDNASVRKALIKRYEVATEGQERQFLTAMLSNLHTPDVLAFSMALASTDNVSHRKDGLEILGGLSMKLPEVRQLALQVLKTEQDPTILVKAIALLQPALAEQTENAVVLKHLYNFAKHDNSAVRAKAISALAGWDKSGESVSALLQALADQSEEVRWAATSAIASNRIRSAPLKTSLIDMANNPKELSDIRLSASTALEHFSLDKEEYVRVIQSAKEADKHLYSRAKG